MPGVVSTIGEWVEFLQNPLAWHRTAAVHVFSQVKHREGAMPGPPPKRTKLRFLEGNPSKRPLNYDEPQPSGELSSRPPADLGKLAKAKWKAVREAAPWLSSADADAVAAYCTAFERWMTAEEVLKESGPVLRSVAGRPLSESSLEYCQPRYGTNWKDRS